MNNIQVLFEKYLKDNSREDTGKFSSYKGALKRISETIGCDIFEITDDNVLDFLAKISKKGPFLKDDSYKRGGFIPAAIKIYRTFLKEHIFLKQQEFFKYPLQQIFYGAPGTGKSHTIKEQTEDKSVIRTTFHPDSDYSTFVGCYKPTKSFKPVRNMEGDVVRDEKEEVITYKFVAQAFLKAYLGAWEKYANAQDGKVEPQFLIIEEINRGNCAQIFGDLFQLLDRGDNGFSEYPIEADTDLQKEIANAFSSDSEFKLEHDLNVEGVVEKYKSNYGKTLSEDIQSGRVLLLPNNLYIWATMNTSDQSLFPIDSAFKRRWNWVYIPIDTQKENWYIQIGTNLYYSWTAFLNKVNNELLTDETAEDKHLGFYFCKASVKKNDGDQKPTIITKESFVAKVLFYLWTDVFKVYGIPPAIGSSKDWAFAKFYNVDGSVNEAKVIELMTKLNIPDNSVNSANADNSIETSNESHSGFVIKYQGVPIEGDSGRQKYIETINRAIAEKGVAAVAECMGTEMTQNPPEETTRDFRKIGDTGWFLATNNSNAAMKSNLNKLKDSLNIDIVFD